MEEERFSVQAGGLSPGSGERGLEKPWFGSSGAVWRAAEGGLVSYVIAVLVGLVLAEVATLITTIYLHRVLSHKAIWLHPALTMFMRFGT